MMLRPSFMLLILLFVSWPGSAVWGQTQAQLPATKEKPAEHVFRAGAATSNITPPLGLPIVGGFRPEPSRTIHDELHARALVLDDGATKIALVVCDNLGIPREVCDAAKELIEKETGILRACVLISATHTHSAASLRGPNRLLPYSEFNDYQKFVVRRIADGVRRALANLAPAQIAWGAVDEPSQVFNRRWHVLDQEMLKNPFGGVDKVRMNPPRGSAALQRPAGPIDPEVSFISVRTPEGKPIALLANYSLHYVGGPGDWAVSADYFGVFAERIGELLEAEKLDPPFVGIMSNGTSGDINNIDFTSKGGERRYQPFERTREVANLIARRVAETHQSLKWHNWVPLAAAEEELTLVVRKPDDKLKSYLRDVMSRPEGQEPFHRYEKDYAGRVEQLEQGPAEVRIVLQALRIGDLGVAAIPFETFAEIGLDIKEKSPTSETFTIELANGSYGYLPTPEQHLLGGYETWMGTNIVELEASNKIKQVIFRLLEQVNDAPATQATAN